MPLQQVLNQQEIRGRDVAFPTPPVAQRAGDYTDLFGRFVFAAERLDHVRHRPHDFCHAHKVAHRTCFVKIDMPHKSCFTLLTVESREVKMVNKWDWADAAACEILCEVLGADRVGYSATLKSIAKQLRQTYDQGNSAGYNLCRDGQLSENIEDDQR